MTSNFLYLSFSTLHSRSLWKTDTTIFTKLNKPPLSNKPPRLYYTPPSNKSKIIILSPPPPPPPWGELIEGFCSFTLSFVKFCTSEHYQAFYVYGRIQLNFSAFPTPENFFTGTHHNLPWVPEVFPAYGGNFRCWPKADTSLAVGASH